MLSLSSPRNIIPNVLLLAAGTLLTFAAGGVHADTASVATAATTLVNTSVAAGTSTAVRTDYSLTTDKQWTNLPGGTRNGPTIGGGSKALTTDLSTTVPSGYSVSPRAAAVSLSQTALSTVGYNTMEEIRHADDVIRSTDNTQSWNYSNYHVAVLVPSSVTSANLSTYLTSSPWMLQISGHHLTYNITYNAPYVSATPMFLGTEPPDYYSIGTDFTTTEKAVVKGTINGVTNYLVSSPYNSTSSTTTTTTDPGVSSGTLRAPLETQRAAVSALATSLQADNTGAKLTGTFSDVVMGVTNNGDGNFPFIGTTPTYPTGTTGRGLIYTSLTTTEKAQVKTVIEAWVKTQAADISTSLLTDYESDAALAQTYVGYQVGAGAADGGATRCNFDALINQEKTPINSQNSYLRVDGPRVWVEMVVQAAVAYRNQNFVHYHSLWRDRLADYGNEFGGYLDTAATSTTYTRPSFTTQPSSATGASATFTAVATANAAGAAVTPAYQWYDSTGAISGATAYTYSTSTAGSYYVTASTAYGRTTSNTVTFTLATAPSVTTQPSSVNVILGNSASFSVTASGTGTLYYQWYKGSVASGNEISGATSATCTIATTTSSSVGTYYCVVGNSYGTTISSGATLSLTEPLANFLSTYGLSSYTADSDGDGISNLVEFALGGNPTVTGTSILPTATYTATGGSPTLVFAFYTVTNLGSVVVSVQYSTDLSTWTTAVNGTGGVTITTTAYSSALNYTTATIPNATGSPLFARLVVTVPGTYSGIYSRIPTNGSNPAMTSKTVSTMKAVRGKR